VEFTGWGLYLVVAFLTLFVLLGIASMVLRYLGTKDPNQPLSEDPPWWIPDDLKPPRGKKPGDRT
jgi:hypothetical protein